MLLVKRKIQNILNKLPVIKNIFRPVYYKLQEISFRDIVRKNEVLKDICKGKRCFMLFSGPSLNEIDFSILSAGVPELRYLYSKN